MEGPNYLWKDRLRHFVLPLSFTRYRLSEDRLLCEKGFFNVNCDEVLLYRVKDMRLTMTLAQRIFGVGTICVISSDASIPHLDLINIKHPRMVKELLHKQIEETKEKHRMRPMEIMSGGGESDDIHEDDLDTDAEDSFHG